MDAEVVAMVQTLREAQDAVQRELGPLAGAPAPDRDQLLRLRDASRAHGRHADLLLLELERNGVVGEVPDTVERFSSFFRDAEARIAGLLGGSAAALTVRRVALCLLGADLLLIGLHVATSAAAMAGWVEGVPTEIRITRPQSLPGVFNDVKWVLAVACLAIVFVRVHVLVFGSLAVVFAVALLNDAFSFYASLADRLARITGWSRAGELAALAALGMLSLGVLLLGVRGLSPEARGLVARFVAVLAGLAAFGAAVDLANAFAVPLGRMAGKGGSLVEEGGEMLLASVAAAYAVGAWRSAGSGARPPGARMLGA